MGLRGLLNRLDQPRTTAVERYEITGEPDIPAWRSPADGRQLYLRPQLAEVTWRQHGEGPWRFRELAIVGDIVGTGLHNARVTFRRRKDVPAWAAECLTPPDWPEEGEGSDREPSQPGASLPPAGPAHALPGRVRGLALLGGGDAADPPAGAVRGLRAVGDLGGAAAGRERMMDGVTDTLPRAVIFDVDGTLALRGDEPEARRFYDWHRVGEDAPNPPVVELARVLADSMRYRLVLMSGRDGVCRPETVKWLDEHDIPWHELWMRAEKDNRADTIVKRELYEQHVAGRYDVAWVVDDRDSVVSLWRRDLGLPCFQVNYGAF